MGQIAANAAAGDEGGDDGDENDADWGDDFDLDAFRAIAVQMLEDQAPASRRRRRRIRPLTAPTTPDPSYDSAASSTRRGVGVGGGWWGLDDKNVQVIADEVWSVGSMALAERGLARVIAEYAVEYLPRYARVPPLSSIAGLPLGDVMYDALWGEATHPIGRRAQTAQIVYDHLKIGNCGWFERFADAVGSSVFGHFVVVWKHPSPRARVVGVVFPYVNPTSNNHRDVVVFGADLLSYRESEIAAAAVEQRRCTCGVHTGRYFMSAHQAPCAVRAEYKNQVTKLFASGSDIERPPADGYYRVHYLRFPRRAWVHSQIEHDSHRIAILHATRDQSCRFGVQSRRDQPPTSVDQMLVQPLTASIFDILPERLTSAPFGVTCEELAVLGMDRSSPQSPRSPRSPRQRRRREPEKQDKIMLSPSKRARTTTT
jgi:hypothetical protein